MKRDRYRWAKYAAAFAAALLWLMDWCGRADAVEPLFMGLGDLPGGAFSSSAFGVSADGSVVVGWSNAAPGSQAFRWTIDTGMVSLGDNSIAYDVSADGSVIVGKWGSQAMRWSQDTGMVGLGDFPRGLFHSYAKAVSADGSVVVGLGTTDFCGRNGCQNIFPAFRWTQESGMVRLNWGRANDASADGSIIVGGASLASSWTQDGGIVGLGDLPGGEEYSMAYGVSPDGSVIVGEGSSAAGLEAFRWTHGTGMVGLGILSGFDFSLAQDVSADGSVVIGPVGFVGIASIGTFIWDAVHGMRNLRDVLINDFGLGANVAGWTLDYASAISADGRTVVGYGTNPNGNTEAWIARLGAAPTISGDFNNDGAIDAADYVVWRKGLGTTYTQTNYDTWRANFGETAGSDTALPSAKPLSASVPEPATGLLLIGGLVAFASRSRRIAREESRFTKAVPCECVQCHRSRSLGMADYVTRIAATCVVVALPTTAAAANYSFTNIAETSGPFSVFQSLAINDSGTVAFGATLDVGGAGIFTGNGGPPTLVVDDSGQFSDFGNLILPSGVSINNGGQIAFFASLDTGGWGIFSSSGGPVTTIADTNGPVRSFAGSGRGPSINDDGTVAFVAGLDAGGAAVLTGNGGPLTTIADSSGPGTFSLILGIHPSINNGGTVVFVANYNAGSGVERGIFTSRGGPATLIVDGSGPLSGNSFSSPPAINDNGTVAYWAQFDTAQGERGIFVGGGTTIADSGGLFSGSFSSKPGINNHGEVAFSAALDAGGSGIFTGPDPIADKVIRTGDSLFGSTVASVGFWGELNDNGDIPFSYGLANGSFGIAVAERLPTVPVPSPIPQAQLRAEASAEFRANTMAGFTASDFDTAGIPGRAEAHASHPNFPTNTAFGQAYAEVPVVPVTTDDLGKVGSRSYAESPLPGFPGGPIDSPTRASAEARQIIKLMVPPGIAQPVDIDMTVHFDGSLQQKVVPGVVVCETPCDPAPRPGPGAQVTTSVSAEVNTYHSAGKLTPFEASAILDWNSGGALKLRADGDWATHWTPLVQPSGGDPGGSSVSYTEFFDDMFFLASNDEYTVEVVLRTEVFNHFISTRLGFVSIADFFNSGAITFSTNTPGVTIVLVPDGLAGDFTRDGIIDAADYVVWRKNDGTQAGYDLWRANFGRMAASSTAVAVPETSAIGLLLVALLGVRFCTRRASHSGR